MKTTRETMTKAQKEFTMGRAEAKMEAALRLPEAESKAEIREALALVRRVAEAKTVRAEPAACYACSQGADCYCRDRGE